MFLAHTGTRLPSRRTPDVATERPPASYFLLSPSCVRGRAWLATRGEPPGPRLGRVCGGGEGILGLGHRRQLARNECWVQGHCGDFPYGRSGRLRGLIERKSML